MAHSDSELIKRTLDGDDTAFGFLVDKYKGAVHALAYRKIGNFHTAEEITQDTFLQAYQKLSTLKDWRHFPGWLYTIASRFCLMWHRKNRLPMQSIDAVERDHVDALAQAKYANEQTRQTVHGALEELPESQRTVLTLHYLGGMTAREIARFMGTSRGAILDRLYRARLQLRKELIPMMRQTLGAFQLPPSFTTQTMNRIDQLRLSSTPASKPLMPWVAAAATLIVAIFIGLGQQSMTRTQRPYSFDATESSVQVELIDAPAFYRLETKPALISRSGRLNSENEKNAVQPESVALGTASNVVKNKGSNYSDWEQTNGPHGGAITHLLCASDGTLYINAYPAGVFRSDDNGDSWVSADNGLAAPPPAPPHHVTDDTHTLTEENGVLYLSTRFGFFHSSNRGELWKWVEYPETLPDKLVTTFAIKRGRIYISRAKDGVMYSDDLGKSWTSLPKGFPIDLPNELMTVGIMPFGNSFSIEPAEKFMTVGTTLFAKRGDDLYRLKDGETSWTRIAAKFQDLRFFIAAQGALFIGSRTDVRRSTDGGNSWVPMTGKIRIWSWENKDVKVDIPWSRVPIELEFRSLSIQGIAGFDGTLFLLLSDGSLLRSSKNGRWETMETGLKADEVSGMAALSAHTVCVATGVGMFRWMDGEKSWRRINKGIASMWVDDLAFFKNTLYAVSGNNDAVLKSVDGGNRWTPIHHGLPSIKARTIAAAGGELYIGLQNTNFGMQNPSTAGIYRLADDETSWIPVLTEMRTHDLRRQLSGVEELAISGNTFYVLAFAGIHRRLFRWRKGEQYWTDISPAVERSPDSDWRTLVVAENAVYFNAHGNLMRSNDEGTTWSRIDTFIGHDDPTKRIDGPVVLGNTVYINVSELGVFRSTNLGAKWKSINDGLPRSHSWELYTVNDSLYASASEGIFRLNSDRDAWEFAVQDLPMATALVAGDKALYAATVGWGVYRVQLEKSVGD